MEGAIDDALEDDTISAALADAARACVREALALGDDRAAALHLLAADALITYACEAAADEGGDALDQLVNATRAERLAHLVDAKDSQ
jgi:hypothetical protein